MGATLGVGLKSRKVSASYFALPALRSCPFWPAIVPQPMAIVVVITHICPIALQNNEWTLSKRDSANEIVWWEMP